MNGNAYEQNIVIDLEFTPVPKNMRAYGVRHEVIEIGAVRMDGRGRMLDEFRCLVRPEIASDVTEPVRELTGIKWTDLEDAPHFTEAFERLVAWIGNARTRMVAWSPSDERQIRQECTAKGVEIPASMTRWMDLQQVFPRAMGVGRAGKKMSLHNAAEWYGLALHAGCEHAALLDAEHTAELLRALMTGEYLEQKDALAAAMPAKAYEDKKPEFGVMAGPLAALYAQMCAAA